MKLRSAIWQNAWLMFSDNYIFFLRLFPVIGAKTQPHVSGLNEHKGDRCGHGPEPERLSHDLQACWTAIHDTR